MLYSVLVFFCGMIVGSFLNVVIYRAKTGQSIIKPKSFCPQCQHILAWYDLFPVVSFILLRGRCRYCHQKISRQYPLVELSAGIIFLFFYFQDGLSARLLLDFWLGSVLLVIFVYDLKYYLILDKFILIGAVPALFRSIFTNAPSFPSALLGSLIGGGFFALIVLSSRGRWMGGGDVKLGFLMGLILGWQHILVALFLAFVGGALVGVFLIAGKKKNLKSAVPFGTFLAASTLLTIWVGDQLLTWYLSLVW